MSSKYAIGVDFGTESARAVLVAVADGREVATAVHTYANGVIDERLPGSGVRLEPDWALQDPNDYIETLKQTIPAMLRESGVSPDTIIGLGIDFTACTMLPTTAGGTPLCFVPDYRDQPHAWVKLWKHHAAQPEADRINEVARERGEKWLDLYGGKISSEWFFSKALQILNEAPHIYRAAGRLIEGADWVIWRLTGRETRNSCTAGYKAIWQKGAGFPGRDYFAALHPDFADVVDTRMSREILPVGARAGGLTPEAADWTGLRPGTAVAVANVDAHVTVPAAQATQPGVMVIIMGTSNCHMVLGEKLERVPGMCGVVEDGIVPGYYGYEAGQSGVGDIFAWFVDNAVPPEYHAAAERAGMNLHAYLEAEAAKQKPGEHGLLALDWWNGNRSVLVDVDLSGLLIGATLATRAPDIYRALIEATAFGTRVIIESFETSGVPIKELVAAGGLPEKNKLLMQIYADVIGLPMKVAASEQTCALGAALFGAAASGTTTLAETQRASCKIQDRVYTPNPENQQGYARIYQLYRELHDAFGTAQWHGKMDHVMKDLIAIRQQARGRK
ncbi:MAG TPA: ribulokinase [Chloroflexi bacterium]|nr:ribulokinase [Chloroflexota bacterium]